MVFVLFPSNHADLIYPGSLAYASRAVQLAARRDSHILSARVSQAEPFLRLVIFNIECHEACQISFRVHLS